MVDWNHSETLLGTKRKDQACVLNLNKEQFRPKI